MNVRVVSAGQIGTECWLPARVLGMCWSCDRVQKCKLPEAERGRVALKREEVASLKEQIKVREGRIAALEKELEGVK